MDEVYLFDEAAKLKMSKYELGGKGYGLVEMTRIKLPVPPGIVITTRMCSRYFKEKKLWPSIKEKILEKMKLLEKKSGKKFGSAENPLFVSVRSGAPVSMPGMMDTVLNLGINDEIAAALSKRTGDRFAYDTYRRFIQLFGSIVLKIDKAKFDKVLDDVKKTRGAKSDVQLEGEDWKEVVEKYKEIVRRETGKEIEQDPYKQLFMAVGAVFESWWNKRAIEYRKIYNIPDSYGTAVSIVTMVYGNYDNRSGTGVAFTRNPSTGEKKLYGEFLMQAQGEDVVAGIRTPISTDELKKSMPGVYKQLQDTANKLEKYFKDMQDIEFTIESGKFYMLQTRNGKRTPFAAIKVATDMVKEGLIKKEEAIMRVAPEQLEQLYHKQIDRSGNPKPIAKGLPASPGAASGKVIFDIAKAVEEGKKGEKIILVRSETTPEDIAGIAVSTGILTSRGGMTSHAAVVTRGMGKPCIVGAEEISIDFNGRLFRVGADVVHEGDIITIDGTSGEVYKGELKMIEPKESKELGTFLGWCDSARRLGIRANADTPEMVRKAMENGAEGVGLARTERMFNAPERLGIVQKMILAKDKEERQKYLSMLKPMQKSDFKAMLEIANGKPVTIRLIDMPLHEFLPKLDELLPKVTEMRLKGVKEGLNEAEDMLSRVMELREANPMMGQRGVRLGIIYTEIYEMQVEAMLEAAIELKKEGKKAELEIMVSQVAIANELKEARKVIEETAERVFKEKGARVNYKIGTMIETPRAALVAKDLANYADFFSFGTNDLTQGTFAFSRDDIEGKLMQPYLNNHVLDKDPFSTVDIDGVGRLIAICSREGKQAKKTLKVGVCGEHGGDPDSIKFFNTVDIDYVSMSPYRVPIAKLAAAQAAINAKTSATTV